MEKKTIGAFLAALRKANGMTQKELADRLHVSDKTVSRWERDDGAPDLALIPVMAEIFGVTCDELLRGERKLPAAAEDGAMTAKGEKQRQRLLKLTISKYRNQTSIAMAVSAMGLTVALVMNLGFLRGTLGFLLGSVFFIISIAMEILCRSWAFLSVEDSGISEKEQSAFTRQVISLGQRSTAMALGCLGFTLPMIPTGAYAGLLLREMLLFGIPGMALCLTAYGVGCYFVNAGYVKQGVYALDEQEAAAYWHNHGLKRKCFCILAGLLAATMAFQAFGMEMLWSQEKLVRERRFEDYDSFVAFMAQDIQGSRITGFSPAVEQAVQPIEWRDGEGNLITEEEAQRHTLEDAHGEVVCTYAWRNNTVATIRPTPGEGTALPIIVTTHAQQEIARRNAALLNAAYCLLYPVEFLGAVWLYFRKRAGCVLL